MARESAAPVKLIDPTTGEPYSVSNPLPVTGGGGGGDATAANQVTIIGHIDTLEALLAAFTKAEDAPHASGDSGIPAWAVRRDADTAFGADNDYAPLAVDANGYLKVNIKAGAGSGGTAMVDDAAFTPATTSFSPVGGIVTADSVDSGDGGAFAMLANRQQKVTLYDSTGAEVAIGGGTQYDEDTASAAAEKLTMAGVVRSDTPTSKVGTDNDRTVLLVDANGRLHIAPVTAIGDLASGAVDSGNPVKIGGIGSSLLPGPVDSGDRVNAWMTLNGAMMCGVLNGNGADGSSIAFFPTANGSSVAQGGIYGFNGTSWDRLRSDIANGLDVDVTRQPARARTTDTISAALATDVLMQGTTARTPAFGIIDAATLGDNTLLAAQGASNKIRVHALYLVAAGTVNARFESGAGGTALSGQMNLVANTGFVLPFNPLGWFETAANTLLNLELSAAISVDGGFVYSVVT